MTAHPRVAEITIGETQRTEEKHLEKEEQDDGDPANIDRPGDIRRDKNGKVVEQNERNRQDAGDAHDIQRIRE